jgi:Antitoxin FitA-like, ribbon-helix-helix
MAIRTTVDIPEALHDTLRQRAAQSGTSMRALIIRALEETYTKKRKGACVTGPLIKGRRGAKLGPLFPKDENPHDLVFS